MPIRVLIVGDVRLYRDGIAGLLALDPRVTVAGTADGVDDALARVSREQPDALLLDMAMRDGAACLRAITAAFESLVVVALALPETADDVIACAEAGAAAYVPRDGSFEDLVATLDAAVHGEMRCPPRIAGPLLRRVGELARARSTATPARAAAPPRLTHRELEVLALIRADRSNKQIAHDLGIELPTVKNHVHNILEKLRVRGRGQAVVAAGGWLPRPRGRDSNPGLRRI